MSRPAHILVIRLSAMGDVAMTVPVLKRITEEYPDLKITVLTRKFFTPLFTGIPRVVVFGADVHGRHKGVAGLKRLSRELQEFQIDAVADLHNVLRSNILKVFFQLQGLPVKQIDKGRKEKRALTRRDHKVFKRLKSTHQRYADVFAALGFPVSLSEISFLPKRRLSDNVKELVGQEPKKWLGIAPFAQHTAKTYPEDLMKEVLRGLEKEENLKIFLFGGGKKETEVLEEWEGKFKNCRCVAGKISFQEELSLISNLDAMISMDSGNGHFAANFGIPVITLWGLTHPYAGFGPYAQPDSNSLLPDRKQFPGIPTSIYGKTIPPGYDEAMRTIKPETILEKIKEVLD